MIDFNKMVNGGEDIVCCYYCVGKGVVMPNQNFRNSIADMTSTPRKCPVCNGTGDVKVVTNKLW